MARHSFVMFGWNWTKASVLGSQVFGQASMNGCEYLRYSFRQTFVARAVLQTALSIVTQSPMYKFIVFLPKKIAMLYPIIN